MSSKEHGHHHKQMLREIGRASVPKIPTVNSGTTLTWNLARDKEKEMETSWRTTVETCNKPLGYAAV